jgi:60 kDa SS-A/Ro ribonucleoprotein
MANRNLFSRIRGKLAPAANAVNEAGGRAYARTEKQALAQYAATGCLNGTFYATAGEQLRTVLRMCEKVDAGFIARTAIYTRERGQMKDMPALLCGVLATRDAALLESIFRRVIDNGKMLRNFVQILRSGVTGRKSLGTAPRRMVRNWLESRKDVALFRDSVGQDPSLADILKMVHPTPSTKEREALYGYLIGREHDREKLPQLVRELEAYRSGETAAVPDVPFQMLTALDLPDAAWLEIARKAPWQMTRMNLNTFARHGVFANEEVTKMIAARLADANSVRKARVLPYQLLTAFTAAEGSVPDVVRDALQDAMEVATANVPALEGKVFVCPDVSGSMSSPVTGDRKGSTSVVRCIDVAALVAASIVRKNPSAEVLPFDTEVVDVRLNVRDSVMTNAQKLASIGGGGTSCSTPLAWLNRKKKTGDLVVFVSDNQSWADPRVQGTAMMEEWNEFKERNPKARLVCIDIQPYPTAQVPDREDVLNVGGFSDAVFEVVAKFAAGASSPGYWVKQIENV